MLSQVFGGVDEPAEHNGIEPVGQQLIDELHSVSELGIVLWIAESIGPLSHVEKISTTPPVDGLSKNFLIVSAGRSVDTALVPGVVLVQHNSASSGVGFINRRSAAGRRTRP